MGRGRLGERCGSGVGIAGATCHLPGPERMPVQLSRSTAWAQQLDEEDRSAKESPRVDVGPAAAVMEDHHRAVVAAKQVSAKPRPADGNSRVIDEDVKPLVSVDIRLRGLDRLTLPPFRPRQVHRWEGWTRAIS